MRLSREVLLRYGRRDPAATDEVNTCCQQRVESYPIVSLHVRLGLFAWLRSELIAAAFDHAARTRGTRTAALVRVSTAVMRIDVCDKHEGDCCMARHVRALHAILRQNGLRCLWTYVEARIDAAHPRVQPHETFQDLRVRNVALKRICESLTLIPFSEGGNDACLLDHSAALSDLTEAVKMLEPQTIMSATRRAQNQNWRVESEEHGVGAAGPERDAPFNPAGPSSYACMSGVDVT